MRLEHRVLKLSLHPALALLLVGATPALAQAPRLTLPDQSPHASVTQRVGSTDITIDYHRPAVGKRKIWGGLVPYGEVWRAGANENTTISFSSPATVGGKQLAAGTYGVHMIPTATTWTVALSNVSTAWGSFSYDPKEDAVRFTVTPTQAENQENLEYRFENPTENSVNVVLNWEKLQISFPVTVDTKAVTLASVKGQLRGLSRFFWQPWNNAAQWCIKAECGHDQALAWADQSISVQPAFGNLMTKAKLVEKTDASGAAKLRADALKLANENDVNTYAYQLLGDKKNTEALEMFRKNVKDHPDSWNVHDSLGEALAATGDKKGATASYQKALSLAKDPVQKKRIETVLAGLK
jgi:TolA-binding protein